MAGTWRKVRTDTELAQVLADCDYAEIVGSGYYEVAGSATVRAFGSATVRAYDSATVSAFGSATVRAFGSATVRAFGSATVRAYGSATVRAYDSATVRASDSATVHASGSATVSAYDSATVSAYDSATVSAYDSATVHASPYVAVYRLSMRSTIHGGVVITPPDLTTVDGWLAYYGIEPEDGTVVLYKGVDDEFRSVHGATYTPGGTTVAEDFQPTNECGSGLHLCPRPDLTHNYCTPERYVAVRVRVADIVPVGSVTESAKVKVPSCDVLYECDVDGAQLAERVAS
ncbi:MAG TPA: hypothetical protein VFJ19_09215 [Nocardioidaceae bacterium]|nr:hypothetical protein [Nocardioidaceae bacterium]